MPETTEQQATPPEGTDTTADGEQQTFSADYVKKLRTEAAEHRKKAKANADAAAKLAEIEEATKTEAQKAADKIADLQAQIPQARAEAYREAAVAFGMVSREDADLFLVGTDIDTLVKQTERLNTRTDQVPAGYAPNAGRSQPRPPSSDDELRELARNLTGSRRT